MNILSIDTSSSICGVSILKDNTLICNLDNNTGRTHSENLMPMIKEALFKAGLTLKEIELIVCDIGPGSFTGIRIGISTAKAFHDSLNIPCIGITSLETLSYNAPNNSRLVCSIIDCKNNNCYFSLYERNNNISTSLIEPQSEDIDSTLEIIKSYSEDKLSNSCITFIGDGAISFESKIKNIFPHAKITKNNNLNILSSYNLGLCGFNKYLNNISIDEDILPLYLKKPQAQRLLEEKMKGTNKND